MTAEELPRSGMVVVLLGPPGAGKGTQALRMIDERSAVHVSTGDLLRAARREGTELGRLAQGYMDRGELVPDSVILDLVKAHLETIDGETDVFFDGFPRTTDQATSLDGVLKDTGRAIGTVVLFDVPDDTLLKRLSGRRSCPDCGSVYNTFFSPPAVEHVCDRCGGALVHRKDDGPETVARRLQVYQAETTPLIDFYQAHPASVMRIAADRDVGDVYADFCDAVDAAFRDVL